MFNEAIEKSLKEASLARSKLSKKPAIIVGTKNSPGKGLYLSNYANCLLNRQIDIFDDSILLLKNDRIPSACIISRGMIETYAFSKLLSKKVAKALESKNGSESAENALELIMGFINSSRIKETEVNLDNGVFGRIWVIAVGARLALQAPRVRVQVHLVQVHLVRAVLIRAQALVALVAQVEVANA